MEWINYHHLLYFWMVAREGSVTRASKELRLAQPTVSGQIRALEDSLGEKLFVRVGRNLVLTDVGQVVFGYADEIFALGKELRDTLKGMPTGRPIRLNVGVADNIPKLIAYRLVAPALEMHPPVQMFCREDKTERLLAALSMHELDLVIADEPLGSSARVRAYNHFLGESGVTFFASEALADSLRPGFPASLADAPMLLPTSQSALRRGLDHFFETNRLRPRVAVECEDSALMKVFGEHGAGIFPGPTVIEKDIRAHYGVQVVGRTIEVRERFYAISVERRIKHPAVARISQAARETLFGAPAASAITSPTSTRVRRRGGRPREGSR